MFLSKTVIFLGNSNQLALCEFKYLYTINNFPLSKFTSSFFSDKSARDDLALTYLVQYLLLYSSILLLAVGE